MRRILSVFLMIASTALAASDRLGPLHQSILNPLDTGKLPGHAMDIAAGPKEIYLLIQSAKRNEDDVIFRYDRRTGQPRGKMTVPRCYASGITTDRTGIYVMGRWQAKFLQQFTYDGRLIKTHRRPRTLSGKMYGLAKSGDNFYIAVYKDKRTTITAVTDRCRTTRPLITAPGKLRSLACKEGELFYYAIGLNTYARHWLHTVGLKDRRRRAFRFIPCYAMSLCFDGPNMLFMRQRRGGASVFAVHITAKRGIVVGNPHTRHVRIERKIDNRNANPYQIDFWFALPFSRDHQDVRDLKISPRPLGIVTDAYGNRWAHIQGKNLKSVTLDFKILLAQTAYTLPVQRRFRASGVPKKVFAQNIRETACFDLSSDDVKALGKGLNPNESYVKFLLAARERVNRKLSVTGPSGPERKASLFLKKGEGRCYAHTLAYAALLRSMGRPARAIGGIQILTDRERAEDTGVHTWNQVYIPDLGWVDIDTQLDDKKSGKDAYNYMGSRSPGYAVTFIGAYEKADRKRYFAMRGWYNTYSWRSLDRQHRAKVRVGRMRIRSRPLSVWR